MNSQKQIKTASTEALLEIIAGFQKTLDTMAQELKLLREENAYYKNKLFGRSKETIEETSGQLNLFQDENELPPAEIVGEEKMVIREHTRKKGVKEEKLAAFPVREIEHELPEEAQTCECCGKKLTDIGAVVVRKELDYIPARLQTLHHKQHSYACKHCEVHGETNIKKAPVPRPLIDNSLGSASVVTETILQKFQQKVPAYRQEKVWQQLGLDISRDNITNWHMLCVQQVVDPLYDCLRKKLGEQEILHADETYYRVLESQKKQTYYWMYCSGHLEKEPIVLYQHSESRAGTVPLAFLGAYQGYVHCDGYLAYDALTEAKRVNCLAHARRKFFEAIPKGNQDANIPAAIGLTFIDQMFRLERQWKEDTPAERLEKRKTQLLLVFNSFYHWIETVDAVPKSKLAKALHYAVKYKKGFVRIFEDGRLELSNNRGERVIKELVIGRKNWLASTSLEGARTSGVILSILKTAEQNGLNIRNYFQLLFTELPNLPVLTADTVQAYLPWTDYVQAQCK